jgi:hypothetical protein
MPDAPTPPKGSSSLQKCQSASSSDTAGDRLPQQLLARPAVEAECVKGQRAHRALIFAIASSIVEKVDQQHRPEDLLLHDRHVVAHADEQRWRELACALRSSSLPGLSCSARAPLATASSTRPVSRA